MEQARRAPGFAAGRQLTGGATGGSSSGGVEDPDGDPDGDPVPDDCVVSATGVPSRVSSRSGRIRANLRGWVRVRSRTATSRSSAGMVRS